MNKSELLQITNLHNQKNYTMKLQSILQQEINSYNSTEPNVLTFVDESSIYWVTNNGHYVWLEDHRGINDYIDGNHQVEPLRHTDKSTEGVLSEGVYWMNGEFESPYHISDLEIRINQINAIV